MLFGFVAALAMAALGCSSERRTPVFPVSGKLLVSGRPAAGARVFFHPQAENDPTAVRPLAVVGPDGSFQATTYLTGDGAPEGEYALTIIWPTKTVVEGEEIEGPDQLHGRFASAAQPAAKVQVAAGDNEIPVIELK